MGWSKSAEDVHEAITDRLNDTLSDRLQSVISQRRDNLIKVCRNCGAQFEISNEDLTNHSGLCTACQPMSTLFHDQYQLSQTISQAAEEHLYDVSQKKYAQRSK